MRPLEPLLQSNMNTDTISLQIVVAISSNGVIGKDGKIPWYLPEDLNMFKKLTLNNPVLMGRKTFFSIINQLGKPLPKRQNLVLTRNKKVENDIKREYSETIVFSSLDNSLKWAKNNGHQKVFIIGGENIYRESLSLCEEIFLTEVDYHFDGDTFFPDINWKNWTAVLKRPWAKSKNNELKYRFCHFRRKG